MGIFNALRMKGLHVAIADNVAISEFAYAKFLDSFGIERNDYQYIQTSMGGLYEWLKMQPVEELGAKVFIVGEAGVLPAHYERVYNLDEANWILCGNIRNHDIPTLQKLRSAKSAQRLLWPHQAISHFDFQLYDFDEMILDIQRDNPSLRWTYFGCPEISSLESLKNRMGISNNEEVLFISGRDFACWDFVTENQITALSVGEESDLLHPKAHYYMNHLRW